MKKLKLQMQITIDGFVAGSNHEMDWILSDWSKDLKEYVSEITSSIDTILLGRKLAQGFIPHWTGVAADSNNPDQAAGKIFTEAKKIIFSNTLKKAEWNNSEIAKGSLPNAVNDLKAKSGKDIIAFGGAEFVSNLIKHNLIDEYYLFVNPSAIGQGLTIFRERCNLRFAGCQQFKCGVVALLYYKS